ncbi:hypothetical protein Pelo_8518 [Pelomyxa schiedti]|nr:hypothetical protein Pelo_8518 [Pelomyxa schiedti]
MSDVTRKYADANPVIEVALFYFSVFVFTNYQQAIQDAERTVTTLSGAMEDLDKQRETILHSLRRLGDVNGSLAKGFRTMRMMARKAIANKLLMGSIAAALVLTILFILFMKFVKPLIGGGDDPSSSGSSVSSFLYNTTTSSNLS